MALKTLGQIRQQFKAPVHLHKWSIDVPTWPTAATPGDPDITFLVQTATLPVSEYTDTDVQLGGFTLQYHGKESRKGEVTWTFVENTEGNVIDYFFVDYPNARQDSKDVSSISLKGAASEDLFAPIVNMNLLQADGEKIHTTYQLVNCLFRPSSPGGDFGQDSEILKPEVTVTFDHFVVKRG